MIDPYNDVLAEDGKTWPAFSAVANSDGLHTNIALIRAAVRAARIPIFILPHRRHEPMDFKGWAHPTPVQLGAHAMKLFAKHSWGSK